MAVVMSVGAIVLVPFANPVSFMQELLTPLTGAAGAVIACEPLQGKGNVVRRMFADIEADTYDASVAPRLVEELTTSAWGLDSTTLLWRYPIASYGDWSLKHSLITNLIWSAFRRLQAQAAEWSAPCLDAAGIVMYRRFPSARQE